MTVAVRSASVEPFLAVEVAEQAQALERTGVDVVHLEFGEPDFEAAPAIREAGARALRDGRTRYVHSLGILPLREAIGEHYARTYGVTVSPDQILVTPGTSPAMMLLFGALVGRGDQVILSDPYYACYPNFIRYAEGEPVLVGTTEEDGFQYRPEAVRARVGPRTRAIVVNSPANPTGAVLAPERLAELAALGPPLVADEIYHGLSYGGRDHTAREYSDAAWVLNGFSKAFGMTGWRLGYVIGPPAGIRALQRAFGNFFISTCEFVQWAGVAALREAAGETARMRDVLDVRRRVLVAGLRRLGFGIGADPAGAFYVLANVRHWSGDSVAFAREILVRAHVALTPGAAFGANAEGHLRFSYAASLERIEEGLARLERFLGGR